MPGALRMDGVVGQIKWAYYVAAAVEGYTVTRSEMGEWAVQGRVVLSDAFKLAQRPLLFVAPHANGEWRFPIVTCRVADGALAATLGPPEEIDVPIRQA